MKDFHYTTRIELYIPEKFAGMNEYITANRTNPHAGNNMKHKYQDIIKAYLLEYKCRERVKGILTPIYISYTFYEKNRRRDLDNISGFFHKVFQDALVETGILKDDGWDYIRGFSDSFKVSDRYGVQILISSQE